MVQKGSTTYRHDNKHASAEEVVGQLASKETIVILDLQDQMVNERKPLDQTAAGMEIQGELALEKVKWAAELTDIQRQMQEAVRQQDQDIQEAMADLRNDYNKKIEDLERADRELRMTTEKLHEARIKRLEEQSETRKEHSE